MKKTGLLLVLIVGSFVLQAETLVWNLSQKEEGGKVNGDMFVLKLKKPGESKVRSQSISVKPNTIMHLSFSYAGKGLIKPAGKRNTIVRLKAIVTWFNADGKDVDIRRLSMGFPPLRGLLNLYKNSSDLQPVKINLNVPGLAKTAQISFQLEMNELSPSAEVKVADIEFAVGEVKEIGIERPSSGPADAGPLSAAPGKVKFGKNLVINSAFEEGESVPKGWAVIGDNSGGAAVWQQGGAFSGKRCLKIIDRGPYATSWGEKKRDNVYVPGAEPKTAWNSGREEVWARWCSEPVPAKSGEVYQTVSFLWYLNRHTNSRGGMNPVRIEFLDKNGKIIPLPLWANFLPQRSLPLTTPGWVPIIGMPLVAPNGTRSVRATVALEHAYYDTMQSKLRKGPRNAGFVLVDNVALYRVPATVVPKDAVWHRRLNHRAMYQGSVAANAVPYVPSSPKHRPNSLGVESLTDLPCGIIVQGDDFSLADYKDDVALVVENKLGDCRKLEIRYQFLNWKEEKLHEGKATGKIDSYRDGIIRLNRPSKLPYGPYTIRYQVFEKGNKTLEGETRIGLLRPPVASALERSRLDYPFATWGHLMKSYVVGGDADRVRALGTLWRVGGVGKQGFVGALYLTHYTNMKDPKARKERVLRDAAVLRKVYNTCLRFDVTPMGLIQPPHHGGTHKSRAPIIREVVGLLVSELKDIVHIWTYGDETLHGAITDLDSNKKPDGTNMMNWGCTLTAREYMQDYYVAYEAAKKADPDCMFCINSACNMNGGAIRVVYGTGGAEKFDGFGINMFASAFSVWPPTLKILKQHGREDLPLFGHNYAGLLRAKPIGPKRFEEEAKDTRYQTKYWVETIAAFPTLFYVPQWDSGLANGPNEFTYNERVRTPYCAYATMTNLLGAGRFIDRIDVPGGSVFVRKRSIRRGIVGVMWSTAPEALAELDLGVEEVELGDMFGNRTPIKTDDGVVSFKLKPTPVYIIGAKYIRPAPSVKIDVVHATVDPNYPQLKVTLLNELKDPVSGMLTLKQESAVALDPSRIKIDPIAPGKSFSVTVNVKPVNPDMDKKLPIRITFKSSKGRVYETVAQPNFHFALKADMAPAIDGNLKDWHRDFALVADREEQIFKYQNKNPWSGPKELSGKLWMKWDAKYLYLAARVFDDGFTPAKVAGNLWAKDSIEMLVSVIGKLQKAEPYTQIALGMCKGKPMVFRYFPGDPVQLKSAEIMVKPIDGGIIYEAAIPWKDLGLEKGPSKGQVISTVFGFNDGDEGTRMMSWFNRVTFKDPSTFGQITLVAPPSGEKTGKVKKKVVPQNLIKNGNFDDTGQKPETDLKSWRKFFQKNLKGEPNARAYLTKEGAFSGRALCIERLHNHGLAQVGQFVVPVDTGAIYLIRAKVKAPMRQISLLLTPLNAKSQPMKIKNWIQATSPATKVCYGNQLMFDSGSVLNRDVYHVVEGLLRIPEGVKRIVMSFSYNWADGKAFIDEVEMFKIQETPTK